MEDLIKALQIFAKYANLRWPTNCQHDVLAIMGVTKDQMSAEGIQAVTELNFTWDEIDEVWISFRFGSA